MRSEYLLNAEIHSDMFNWTFVGFRAELWGKLCGQYDSDPRPASGQAGVLGFPWSKEFQREHSAGRRE